MSDRRRPAQSDLTTSAFARLFRLGSVASRVGLSLATEQAVSFLFSDPIAQARRTEKLMLNALRVTEALGELKGAAMKVGQMLSVQEGLLPPEFVTVLRSLQKEAPQVPFQTMRAVLSSELASFDQLFESLDGDAIAAASIGQVYRGRLRDGRDVAVKVQYPQIDEVVRSDLKNLKKLFGSLVAMVSDVAFEPIWEELRERLLEELDYRHEAANLRRMRELHRELPEILVPDVVPEASTARVLTMDYLQGISPEAATSGLYDQRLRNLWGRRLVELVMRGLLDHRFLHADPNLANYAFLEDGRLIVYDHGCMKEISVPLAEGYRGLLHALLAGDVPSLPERLARMGICRHRSGSPVPLGLIEPLAREAVRILSGAPYRFSRDTDVYDLLFESKTRYFRELGDISMPPDLVFVNRTLAGLFGNLCRLEVEDRWRDVVAAYAEPPAAEDDAGC